MKQPYLLKLLRRGQLALSLVALVPVVARATKGPPALLFEENKTQWDPAVRYRAAVPGGTVWLRSTGFTYAWTSAHDLAQLAQAEAGSAGQPKARPTPRPAVRAHAVQVDFEGAAPTTQPSGQRVEEAYSNYFVGNDPSRWAGHVRSYQEVRYTALYPGTDLRVYGTAQGQFEYDLTLAPGADPDQIRLRYRGTTTLRVLPGGALAVGTSVGEVREQQPVAYQLAADGQRQPVPCRYRLAGTTVSFELPAGYDHARPLVIDPVVQAATYVGVPNANGTSLVRVATHDGQGNLYLAGVATTQSGSTIFYPVSPGAYVVPQGSISLTKLNATGTARLYSTHFGGTQSGGIALAYGEEPCHMSCDAAGNLVIFGETRSADFPTLATSYDRTLALVNGVGQDAFIIKLSAAGDAVLASTYLGGTGPDTPFATGGLHLDASGEVYVAGATAGQNGQPNDFPTTPGAYVRTNQATGTGFIAHLDPQLSTLRWSTFLQSSPTTSSAVFALRVSPATGQVYFVGYTSDTAFPASAGAASAIYSGGYVGCLAANGSQLLGATYLPGTPTIGASPLLRPILLTLDVNGNVYVAGNGILVGRTPGSYVAPSVTQFGSLGNVFITQLSADLTRVVHTAVLGGGDVANVAPMSLGIDQCGNALLAVSTFTYSGVPGAQLPVVFPTANVLPNGQNPASLYLAGVSRDFTRLVFGSYYGTGSGISFAGYRGSIDPQGRFYVPILTRNYAGTYPTLPTAYQPAPLLGAATINNDVVGVIIDPQFVTAPPPRALFSSNANCTGLSVFFGNTSTNAGPFQWDFGDGSPLDSVTAFPQHAYATAGVYRVRLWVRPVPGACSRADTTSQLVAVGSPPARVLPLQATLCPGTPLVLDAGNPGSTYTWSTGATTQTIAVTVAGRYFVAIRNPCGRTDTVRVGVAPAPTMARDSVGCGPVTLGVAGAPLGSTFRWSTGATTASITVEQPGRYTVAVATPTCQFQLQADAAPASAGPQVPNIFTPNPDDALNATFKIPSLPVGTRLRVFSRWGKLVYQSPDYHSDWAAAGLPDGVYYYLLENARFCQSSQLKGWVEVRR
jgi:PKD repeat protein